MPRVGDFDKTFGESLDVIDGEEVTLHSVNISQRQLNGEDRPFTLLEVSNDKDGPTYTLHTWSESVAEKLGSIPADAYPLEAKFSRVKTSGGFEVWDVK